MNTLCPKKMSPSGRIVFIIYLKKTKCYENVADYDNINVLA